MPRRTGPLVLIHASSQRASSVHELLVAKGFSVLEAQAADLLELFLEFRPDMVLLEHQAGNQTTKDLARGLRDTDLGQVVPIILFGDPPGPAPVDIVSMGADQFASLPLDETWLKEKLARLGGKERSEEQSDAGMSSGDGAHQGKENQPVQVGGALPDSTAPGLPTQTKIPSATGGLETNMDIFGAPLNEDASSVLGAISDVLSPADLPMDQDIDIDDLDVETTIPGIVDQGSGILEGDTGESDLDVSDDTDQDLAWKDSRTSRIEAEEREEDDDSRSPPLPAKAKPGSLGAVSLPPWQVSTSGSMPGGSGRPAAPQRPSGANPPSPFDPTHLAEIPSSTEVITDGNPASPEQDTVVGLKWKLQERRHTRTGHADSHPKERDAEGTGPNQPIEHDHVSRDEETGAQAIEKSARQPKTDETTGTVHQPETSRQRVTPRPGNSAQWIPKPIRPIPDFPLSLDAVRPMDAFMALASHQVTTGLRIHCDVDDLEIIFRLDDGFLSGASCEAQDLSFLHWAVRRSFLTRDQVNAVLVSPTDGGAGAGDRVWSLLVNQRFLVPSQLAGIYQAWVAWLFYEAVSWRKGSMDQTAEDRVTVPVPVHLDWASLVCEAVRRKYPATLALSLVGGPEVHRAWRSEEAMQRALALPDLSVAESRALTMLGEGLSLGECARRTGIGETELAALIHGLDILGILMAPDRRVERAPSLGSPRAQAVRIEAKLDQVREGDYYSLLGVLPTASLREIRAAHEQMRQSFEDATLAEEVRTQFAEELTLIREALDEALAVLTHPRYATLYAEAFLKDRK